MPFLDFLEKNWSMIVQAPFTFAGWALCCFLAGYWLAASKFKSKVENANERAAMAESRLALLKDQTDTAPADLVKTFEDALKDKPLVIDGGKF